jgi:hypothetical protein
MPSSPLGYQVATVADETLPEPPPRYPVVRRHRAAPPTRIPALAIWGPCVLVAFFVVVFLSACAMASRPRPMPAPNDAVVEVPVAQADIPAGRAHIIIPEVNAADAAEAAKANALPKGEAPPAAVVGKAACQPGGPGDRETFGTAVEFVRNPVEATRAAGQQRKLAFLLHVSGNFEEARFT